MQPCPSFSLVCKLYIVQYGDGHLQATANYLMTGTPGAAQGNTAQELNMGSLVQRSLFL